MLAVAILAAGKGTRMKSALPKVLQPLSGISLLERVLANCNQLEPQRRLVIVGHQATRVENALSHIHGLEFVLQDPQNGTGHAIQQIIPTLHDFQGELLVLNGDVPLLRSRTIERLVQAHRSNNSGVTFLTTRLSNPMGYGRVFANKQGFVEAIVEDKDCTEEQRTNTLTNSGIYCFDWKQLASVLPKLSTNNSQKEIYLTDTISLLKVAMHIEVNDPGEVLGINDRSQMAKCEEVLQQRLREHWMKEGVTFIDPSSCTLSENCIFGKDIVIEPQTHLRGNCQIADRCRIGPGTLLEDAELGTDVRIIYSVINGAKVGNNVVIGPYAHLRPKAVLQNNCRIGNFVEIKQSYVGEGSKVSHLSYIGDAELGKKVNVGAGTITANFDGTRKHLTVVGDYTKTGANSVLVAPIVLGSRVTVGAGSTLTKNVPDGSLALGRAKQLIKKGWSV